MNKVTLVIPVFNRPQYLKQCFDTLLKCDMPDGLNIILINDASTDQETIQLFNELTIADMPIIKLTNQTNKGINYVLLFGFNFAFDTLHSQVVINLDSDAIVKSDFFTRLLGLQSKFTHNICTGFNCNGHPLIKEYEGFSEKRSIGGINMCFDKEVYEKYIKPSLLKPGNWDYNSCMATIADNKPSICLVPSAVQHIGHKSTLGHDGVDVADDFKSLALPDVTLIGIDWKNKAGIVRAGNISTSNIEFGGVKIITDIVIDGHDKYSEWCIKDMYKFIDTSHMLIIHADGFVLNWKSWDKDWLQYDYIGATWWYKDNMNVGNGGFSLRSKRLMEYVANIAIVMHPEDDVICRHLRPQLEAAGFKFAPEEVANKFAIEAYNSPDNKYKGQFGFHGKSVDFSTSNLDFDPVPKPKSIQNNYRHNIPNQFNWQKNHGR